VWIRGERLADDGATARYHMEHVRGQDLIAQLDDADHREGRGFTRLQHDRVPHGKGRRDLSTGVDGGQLKGMMAPTTPNGSSTVAE
jgi:hypothetical protein